MNETIRVRRVESRIRLSDALPRHRREWLPDDPQRAMIIMHGSVEHCGRYDEMAMHFAAEGFVVHAYDQSGHGRSPGPRGDVDRFDRMLDELAAFVEFVVAEHRNVPVTVVGHSMGGLVAAATCAFRKPSVDRLILAGALLERSGATSMRTKLAMRFLSPLGSRVGLSTRLEAGELSRDPEVGRRYEADPFVGNRISARFAAGMTEMVDRMSSAAAMIECPALILHGGADPISPESGSRAFHARLTPQVASKSALRIYPDLRHEILQEPERHGIWQDILEWSREAK